MQMTEEASDFIRQVHIYELTTGSGVIKISLKGDLHLVIRLSSFPSMVKVILG